MGSSEYAQVQACRPRACHAGLKHGDRFGILFLVAHTVSVIKLTFGAATKGEGDERASFGIDSLFNPNIIITTILLLLYVYIDTFRDHGDGQCSASYIKQSAFQHMLVFSGLGVLLVHMVNVGGGVEAGGAKQGVMFVSLALLSAGMVVSSEVHARKSGICDGSRTDAPMRPPIVVERISSCFSENLVSNQQTGAECQRNPATMRQEGDCLLKVYEDFGALSVGGLVVGQQANHLLNKGAAASAARLTKATRWRWRLLDSITNPGYFDASTGQPIGCETMSCSQTAESVCQAYEALQAFFRSKALTENVTDFEFSATDVTDQDMMENLAQLNSPLRMNHAIHIGSNNTNGADMFWMPSQAESLQPMRDVVGYRWVAYHSSPNFDPLSSYSSFDATRIDANNTSMLASFSALKTALSAFYHQITTSSGMRSDTGVDVMIKVIATVGADAEADIRESDDLKLKSEIEQAIKNKYAGTKNVTVEGISFGQIQKENDELSVTITLTGLNFELLNKDDHETILRDTLHSSASVSDASTLSGKRVYITNEASMHDEFFMSNANKTFKSVKFVVGDTAAPNQAQAQQSQSQQTQSQASGIVDLTKSVLTTEGQTIGDRDYIMLFSNRIWRKVDDKANYSNLEDEAAAAALKTEIDRRKVNIQLGETQGKPFLPGNQPDLIMIAAAPGVPDYSDTGRYIQYPDEPNSFYVSEKILLLPNLLASEGDTLLRNTVLDGAGAFCKKEMQRLGGESFTLTKKSVPTGSLWRKIESPPTDFTLVSSGPTRESIQNTVQNQEPPPQEIELSSPSETAEVLGLRSYVQVTSSGVTMFYALDSSFSNDKIVTCEVFSSPPGPFQIKKSSQDDAAKVYVDDVKAITYYESEGVKQSSSARSNQKPFMMALGFGAFLMACALLPMRRARRDPATDDSPDTRAPKILATLVAVFIFLSYMARFEDASTPGYLVSGIVCISIAIILTFVVIGSVLQTKQGTGGKSAMMVRLCVLFSLFAIVHSLLITGMTNHLSPPSEEHSGTLFLVLACVFSFILAVAQTYFGGDFVRGDVPKTGKDFGRAVVGGMKGALEKAVVGKAKDVGAFFRGMRTDDDSAVKVLPGTGAARRRNQGDGFTDAEVGDLFRGGRSAEEVAPTRGAFVPVFLTFVLAFHASRALSTGVLIGVVLGVVCGYFAIRVEGNVMVVAAAFAIPFLLASTLVPSDTIALGGGVMKYVYYLVGMVCLFIQAPSADGLQLEDASGERPSMLDSGRYPPSLLYALALCAFAGFTHAAKHLSPQPEVQVDSSPEEAMGYISTSLISRANLLTVVNFLTVILGVLIQSFTGVGGRLGAVLRNALIASLYLVVLRRVKTTSLTCGVKLYADAAGKEPLMEIDSNYCGGSYDSPGDRCVWSGQQQEVQKVEFTSNEKACMLLLHEKNSVDGSYTVQEQKHMSGVVEGGPFDAVSVVELCSVSIKASDDTSYVLKPESVGKKTLTMSDFQTPTALASAATASSTSSTVSLKRVSVRGKDCRLKVFPEVDFTGGRGTVQTFGVGDEQDAKNMGAGSFVLGKKMHAWRPEVLPFAMTSVDHGTYSYRVLNVFCIVALFCAPLSFGAAMFLRRGESGNLFRVAISATVFFFAMSFFALSRQGGADWFSTSGPSFVAKIEDYDKRDVSQARPGVVVAVTMVCAMASLFVYVALQPETSPASRGYFSLLALVSLVHGVLVINTSTTLPFILYSALFAANSLVVSGSLPEKIVSIVIIVVALTSVLMLLSMSSGLTHQDMSRTTAKALGVDGANSYVGESADGACASSSSPLARAFCRYGALFESLGLSIKDFFDMTLVQTVRAGADAIDGVVERVLGTDECKDKGTLCEAAVSNACEFSYCIDPPRATRMRSWSNEASGMRWEKKPIGARWARVDVPRAAADDYFTIPSRVTKLLQSGSPVTLGDVKDMNGERIIKEGQNLLNVRLTDAGMTWAVTEIMELEKDSMMDGEDARDLVAVLRGRSSLTLTQAEVDARGKRFGVQYTAKHFAYDYTSDNTFYYVPVGGLSDKQAEDRTRRACDAHRSFFQSALAAKNPTAGQKYCLKFHKDDSCENVCSKHWGSSGEAPKAMTREALQRLDSRLDIIDDSQLQMSDGEFVRMLRDRTMAQAA